MEEYYLGTILLFAGNFAPKNFAYCDGSLLPIASYNALYSILGTTYGGNGVNNFALPDLRGRVPIGTGTAPGLSPVMPGMQMGQAYHTLTISEMPPHGHVATVQASTSSATSGTPAANSTLASTDSGRTVGPSVYGTNAPNVTLNTGSIPSSSVGGGQSIDMHQPSLGMNYIICVEGLYPSRS